jgi:1-deoxy-D-xylulose-5-phosphate reductoisomerase
MGAKISVDSATLVNKCFEIIEAYWYFHTTKIEALYHPTSFIHAIVKYQFKTLMFGCKPDMRTSIMQSLTLFKNSSPYVLPLKQKYILEKINRNKWIPMKWAHVAIKNPKSSLPIIINAANEEAIHLFAKNLISFPTIIKIIQKCIKKFSVFQVTKIEDVYAMDYKIREYIHSIKILKQH